MNLIRNVALAISLLVFCIGVEGQRGLSYNFYENSCPQVEAIVRAGLQPIFLTDPSSPAALLRLLFHDCQVQGCDASILVDRNPNESIESSEMAAGKNFGIRKRESINILKSMVELECPQQVSCADILVLAAREAVATAGGPQINVPLGRRDSAVPPSNELADFLLPPTTIGVDGMLQLFAKKGITVEESVAIMGAHTLGVTHCLNVLERLKEQEGGHVRGMEPGFEAFLRLKCPQASIASNASFVLNDPTTLVFDNHYYGNVVKGYGVLRIDAEMVMDPRTAPAVQQFAANQDSFFRAFSSAFVKLSSSGVLTGNQGVIRNSCNSLD